MRTFVMINMIDKLSTSQQPFAVEFLKKLYQKTISNNFSKDLNLFAIPKEYRSDIFAEGVLLFTKIANLSPLEREDYYGSDLLGLHYNNGLAKLCNSRFPQAIEAYQLNKICSSVWDYSYENNFGALIYSGDDPSSALDKLLQGPTVIDCGMFCQLSIWFGIKYMVGHQVFNELFGHAPFYVTQLNYQRNTPTEPYFGNPLYPFFRKAELEELENSSPIVSMVYLSNHQLL